MADLRRYPASAATLRTLPLPQPFLALRASCSSPAADAGASCEGGGRWIVVATTVAESFTEGDASEQERQAPLFRRSAPSLAGRSPQWGRVGEGVAILLMKQNFGFSRLLQSSSPSFASQAMLVVAARVVPVPQGKGAYQRYSTIFVPAFTGEGAHYPASAATSRTLPPPQPFLALRASCSSPAAGFALQGRG